MPGSALSSLAAWQGEIPALLPQLSRSQARVRGEMVDAMLLIDGCGMTRIWRFLSSLLGKSTGTLRQKYRGIFSAKEGQAGVKKRGGKRREITVEEHFADLWRGVLRGWEGERMLALALDARTLSDRFAVLSISVLTRGGATRVAWPIGESHQEGGGRGHGERLLSLLGEAVPADWPVFVMADRGLYAAWLVEAIQARGGHPLWRVNGLRTFRAEGSAAFVRVEELVKQAGKRWKGKGEGSETGERLGGTLLIQWEKG